MELIIATMILLLNHVIACVCLSNRRKLFNKLAIECFLNLPHVSEELGILASKAHRNKMRRLKHILVGFQNYNLQTNNELAIMTDDFLALRIFFVLQLGLITTLFSAFNFDLTNQRYQRDFFLLKNAKKEEKTGRKLDVGLFLEMLQRKPKIDAEILRNFSELVKIMRSLLKK